MTRTKDGARTWILAAIAAALVVVFTGMHAYAAEYTAAIQSAYIVDDQVVVWLETDTVPATDDGIYYFFANEVYQSGAEGELVATMPASTSSVAVFPLNFNTASSNLSRNFVVCVLQNGAWVQICSEYYITNPEAASDYASTRYNSSIKGLFVDPERSLSGELQDLGVDQVSYNIYLGDIVGETSNAAYPTTYFTYDGVTYAFDSYALASYDGLFVMYQVMGMEVTVNIINNLTAEAADIIHPLALDGTDCPCYAFNTTNAAGVKHLEAIAYFLGSRYDGTNACGLVDNWVIGNEINARTEQYYMSNSSLEYNVSEYHKAFRIFYNGLKAANSSVRVYNSLDQEWTRLSNDGSFAVKDYLDLFNETVTAAGNIDWGLSFHPYNSPLYDPYTWMGMEIWVGTDVTTPYITMQNLFVLIDYMNQAEFLSPSGECRSIVLSEIGFTSYFADEDQCASIVYAYLQASYYTDIDGFLMYREVDNADEISNRIAQGLVDVNGNIKSAYAYYKAMGTADQQTYIDLASAYTGYDILSLIGSRTPLTRNWQGY